MTTKLARAREIKKAMAKSGAMAFYPVTPEWVARAKAFFTAKWAERAAELGRPAPMDLSSACKFGSLFAQALFGGALEGNYDHQFVRLPGGSVLDLGEDAADRTAHGDDESWYEHDEDFWDNPEHRKSLDSVKPRVERWVTEFRGRYPKAAALRNSLPKVLYHGTTSDRLPAIMEHGLQPAHSASSSTAIYLTDDFYTAEGYGNARAEGDAYPVVLQVNGSLLDPNAAGPDDAELPEYLDNPWGRVKLDDYSRWSDVPWQLSLKAVNQITYDKPIPASALSVVPKNPKAASLIHRKARRLANEPVKERESMHGLTISIEFNVGDERSGTSKDGKKWSRIMECRYGFIEGNIGADGEDLDVYLGPDIDSEQVFVVNQLKKDGSFDEHKVMLGWPDYEAAVAGYLANYPKDWNGMGSVRAMTWDEFEDWRHDKKALAKVAYDASVTKQDIMTLRPLIRQWVAGGYDDRDSLKARMAKYQAVLAKFRPTKPMRLWRNERIAGPNNAEGLNNRGHEDQYEFPTAWSATRHHAETYASGRGRRLVTVVAQPQDILASVPEIDAAARKLGLKPLDEHAQDEVILAPNASCLARIRPVKAEADLKPLQDEARALLMDLGTQVNKLSPEEAETKLGPRVEAMLANADAYRLEDMIEKAKDELTKRGAPRAAAEQAPIDPAKIRRWIRQTNPHGIALPGRDRSRDALSPVNNDSPSRYIWSGPVTIQPGDPRVKLISEPFSPEDVEEYRQMYQEGSEFPPVFLVESDRFPGKWIVYDGNHRIAAAWQLKVPIEAYVGVPKPGKRSSRGPKAKLLRRAAASNPFTAVVDQFQAEGLTVHLSVSKDYAELNSVIVPKDKRGQGLGSKFMQALIEVADAAGYTLFLTPSTDFGGSSVARLKQFYRGFGFVPNSGGRKDFRARATMVREPRSDRQASRVAAKPIKDIAALNAYLTMPDEDKGLELAERFPELFDEWTAESESTEEEYAAFYQTVEADGGLLYDLRTTPGCPAFLFMESEGFVHNRVMVHFTSHAEQVAQQGFTKGVADPSELGLTRSMDDADKTGGYNFAYLVQDMLDWQTKRGGQAHAPGVVVFKASGLRVWHQTDREYQVIFKGSTARDRVAVLRQGDQWMVGETGYADLIEAVKAAASGSKSKAASARPRLLRRGSKASRTASIDYAAAYERMKHEKLSPEQVADIERRADLILGRTAGLDDVGAYIQEFKDFLDPEGKFSMPTWKVVDRANVKWLGLCKTKYTWDQGYVSKVTSEIFIQKGVGKDEKTLRQVVAHEVCHHIYFCEQFTGKTVAEAKILAKLEGDHGPGFLGVAARINAHYGAGFVDRRSDENSVYEKKEAFLILRKQREDTPWRWSWVLKFDKSIAQTLSGYQTAGGQIRVVKSTDHRLLAVGAKWPTWFMANGEKGAAAVEAALQQPDLWPEISKADLPTKKMPPWYLVMMDSRAFHGGGGPIAAQWAKAPLSAKQKNDISMWRIQDRSELGTMIRVVKMTGAGNLKDSLRPYSLGDLIQSPGLNVPGMADFQAAVQEQWDAAQPLATAPPPMGQTAALRPSLLRRTAIEKLDMGEIPKPGASLTKLETGWVEGLQTPDERLKTSSSLTPISFDEARALLKGKTEKSSGTDPVAFLNAAEGNGRQALLGTVSLSEIRDNEEADLYDSTVNPDRVRDYAQRPSQAPPVILTAPRSGGKYRVVDGGHRVSAARQRGDAQIQAIVLTREPVTAKV